MCTSSIRGQEQTLRIEQHIICIWLFYMTLISYLIKHLYQYSWFRNSVFRHWSVNFKNCFLNVHIVQSSSNVEFCVGFDTWWCHNWPQRDSASYKKCKLVFAKPEFCSNGPEPHLNYKNIPIPTFPIFKFQIAKYYMVYSCRYSYFLVLFLMN